MRPLRAASLVRTTEVFRRTPTLFLSPSRRRSSPRPRSTQIRRKQSYAELAALFHDEPIPFATLPALEKVFDIIMGEYKNHFEVAARDLKVE